MTSDQIISKLEWILSKHKPEDLKSVHNVFDLNHIQKLVTKELGAYQITKRAFSLTKVDETILYFVDHKVSIGFKVIFDSWDLSTDYSDLYFYEVKNELSRD